MKKEINSRDKKSPIIGQEKFYTLPLTDAELDKIKNGGRVDKIFQQDSISPLPLLVVTVGKCLPEKSAYDHVIRSGDDVATITVIDEQIEKIRTGEDVAIADYGKFKVGVCSKERYENDFGKLKTK